MRRWFWLTLGMYLVTLVALGVPLAMLAFWPHESVGELVELYELPIVWIWVGVFVGGQALLLLVPIGSAERRPKARRKLLVPVITSAFFMAVMGACALECVVLALWGENGDERLGRLFSVDSSGTWLVSVICGLTALGWVFWGWLFYRYRRTVDPDLLTQRLMRWLLAGSILELLVAVPSHVIVRQRGDCCAPAGTFVGMCCGLSVMLLSFGPGVFFLFARRVDLLRGRLGRECGKCGYDLRAHRAGELCPECGTEVPAKIGAVGSVS